MFLVDLTRSIEYFLYAEFEGHPYPFNLSSFALLYINTLFKDRYLGIKQFENNSFRERKNFCNSKVYNVVDAILFL